jgi:hypothetical protein
MIYTAQCLKDIYIVSLRFNLVRGQSFDCPKVQYDSNHELQKLVNKGFISLKVKGTQGSRLGVHSNNRFQIVRESKVVKEIVEKVVEKPVIVEKIIEKEVIVEKIVEKEPQMNMDQLAQVLLQQLGSIISPEAIAEAVAKQMPTQQVVVEKTQNPHLQGNINTSSDEALTFIPSNIISNTAKASSESLANETKSDSSSGLSDALSALKALRKANKK